jgi:hypothetical protein
MISTFHKSFSSDQIKKQTLEGAYSTYEGEKSTKRDLERKHGEGGHLEDVGVRR